MFSSCAGGVLTSAYDAAAAAADGDGDGDEEGPFAKVSVGSRDSFVRLLAWPACSVVVRR